jgi:heterodisulfide reductase subunit B
LKYALYLGCTIQSEQFGYEASVREVLPRLGVELEEMRGVSCCGFPAFSSVSPAAWFYLSARNLAIAGGLGLDIFPLCNGCSLSFVETKHNLEMNPQFKKYVEENLRKEGLEYNDDVKVVHILEVLHDVIGTEKIRASVKKPISGLKFAAHPGCHAIRPSSLGRPDDPENPQKLDDLIKALGAETMDYPEKTDCCGSTLAISSGKTTLMIAGEKLQSIRNYGFDGLVTICPFCFKVFDNRQRAIQMAMGDRSAGVPVFYYTQLLGLAMGIEPERLGLELNLSPVDAVIEKIRGGNS